ncbi:MAG: hypothetical protein NTW80_08375, partial [Deltaproteobacteria bacterium]|nr:hypothetical protein [Deltaproteobacteria bacterium]
GFIKSALYRKIARDLAKDQAVMDLLYPSDEGSSGGVGTISELLAQLREKAPRSHDVLVQLLADYQIFLVVNMVKSNTDLTSPDIINSVCTDFLSLKPEVMGHVSHDPTLEAAVNRISQFPLSNKKSKAAGQLAQIALKIVKESMLPRSGWTDRPAEPEDTEEPALGSLLTQSSFTS